MNEVQDNAHDDYLCSTSSHSVMSSPTTAPAVRTVSFIVWLPKSLDELGIRERTVGVAPVGCSVSDLQLFQYRFP